MAFSGTVYRVAGTQAYMYSRNGPFKYPVDIRGMDPAQVLVGHRYEVDDQGMFYAKGASQYHATDVAKFGLGQVASQPPPVQQYPQQAPPQYQQPVEQPPVRTPAPAQGLPEKELIIAAQAICKSAIEQKVDPAKAIRLGLAFASLWGTLPPRAAQFLSSDQPLPIGMGPGPAPAQPAPPPMEAPPPADPEQQYADVQYNDPNAPPWR